jgi:hypothetical protein
MLLAPAMTAAPEGADVMFTVVEQPPNSNASTAAAWRKSTRAHDPRSLRHTARGIKDKRTKRIY